MILTSEDIMAIASEVVRQMRMAENTRLDAEYLASLPIEELKKIQRAKWEAQKAAMKRQKN